MTQATDMLAAYIAAETAVLLGKETSLGDRRLRMEDLAEIRAGRQEWQQKVNAESAASKKSPTVGGLGYSVARFDK